MRASAFALILALAAAPALAADPPPASAPPGAKLAAWKDLPDWSGVWVGANGSGWDSASMTKGGIAGLPGAREHPPLTPEWEKKYQANIARVAQDRYPDPVSFCGTPSGFPRSMSIPDGYEFVVRPEQTWVLTENGPNVMRIYTDGRKHPGPDDLWATYTGDSVGYWEGQTLVFDTIGLNGDPHTILDRTGLTYSSKAHVLTRLYLTGKDTLTATITIVDPEMLTQAWTVTKHYKRQPPGSRIYDYACTENNRNPITATGQTLTLGTDGKPIDKTVDPGK
ncbi:MAG TPA: hypothetical protein VIJ94_18020 [Caulobacteraceae bacterium]